MNVITTNCIYSNPVRYDGSLPTLPTHAFYFENSVCTVSQTATSSGGGGGDIILNAYNPTTTISSSSDIQIYGAMSAGEIMISFFLLIQIILIMTYFLIKSLSKIETQKEYIEYTNGDVPISKNL